MEHTYIGIYYRLEGRAGIGRESAREGEAEKEEAPVYGVKGSFRTPLTERLTLSGGISYLELPHYQEFSASGGLTLAF